VGLKMKFCNLLSILVVMSLVVPVFASKKLVAILETAQEGKNTQLEAVELSYLSEIFRKKALEVLGTQQFHIMTKDNILMMLPPGKQLSDCLGECIVETGKNVGAHYVTQGSVRKIGKKLTFTASLFDTQNNQLLGSLNIRAVAIDDFIDSLIVKSPSLFKVLKIGAESTAEAKKEFENMVRVEGVVFKNHSLKTQGV
jgi:hypothetical protein